MKFKRIFTAIVMLVLFCTVISVCTPESHAYSYIGQCGKNITYFHLADNTLYISGSGAMYDYSESNPAPWKSVASSITSVSISGDVTVIGNYAFAGCNNLKNISGGSGVKTVGSHAFDGCAALTKLPFGSVSIGSYAFKGCTSLSSVSLGNGITTIPEGAFYNCKSLTSITIPEGLTAIEASAFEGCSSLEGVDLPAGVSAIGANTFNNCTSMKSFTVPEGVKVLEDGIFSGCTNLGSIAIHESLMSLGNNAFNGCSSLLAIVLPDTLTEIGEGVFSGCSSLTSISLTDGISFIPNNAFSKCTALAYIKMPTNIEYIGADAFNGCTVLSAIDLYEGITAIGNNAFSGCLSLTSCILPSSINTIGDSVFEGCNLLNEVKFMGYLTKWDDVTVGANNILLSADNIVTEYIDGGNIGNGIYWSVSNAGSIIITGNGEMSDFVLNDTPWIKYSDIITSISVDDQITSVGAYTFSGLTELTDAQLPKGITKISSGMFYGCTSLKSVIGLENLTHIGKSAFENCSSLVINNTYDLTLGVRAFAGCTAIEKISIAGEFIADEAFADCSNLSSIIIKDTVTTIGEKAFSQCPLVSANFTGTEEMLDGLIIGDGNDNLEDVLDIYSYIRNIYIGRGANKSEAMASIEGKADGILKIDITGSDSMYVCLGYSLTNDPEEALTGVVLYSTKDTNTDGSVEFNDITYYLISTPVTTDGNGNSVYLCTTKDVNAGDPIYMIGLRNNSNNRGTFKDGESWLRAFEVNGDTPTFDSGTEGVTLHYTTDLSADIGSPINVLLIFVIGIVCLCLVSGGVGMWFYLKKKGVRKIKAESKEKIFQ